MRVIHIIRSICVAKDSHMVCR